MSRFDEIADDEWKALLPELHGLAVDEQVKMIPSDEALMAGIVEYLEAADGAWRAASRIVGCRLSDRAGLTICEIPAGEAGWRLLWRLVQEGRVEKHRRQRGREDWYWVFMVAP